MVAISLHDLAQLCQMLRRGTEVANLVEHQHSDSIAYIEKLRRWRVVGTTDGVAAHLLQPANAELPNRIWYRYANAGVILVVARAFQVHALAIEEKAFFGVPMDLAEAKGG